MTAATSSAMPRADEGLGRLSCWSIRLQSGIECFRCHRLLPH
jgi:hypothetical protein